MSARSIETVYIDTNILVSYALGREKEEQFDLAKKVFNEALDGTYKIMISNFMLSETLNTLRRIITKNNFEGLQNGLSQEELWSIAKSFQFEEKIKRESEKAFSTIIDKISKDTLHFVFENHSQIYKGEIFQNSLGILSKTFGTFKVYRFKCEKCDAFNPCRSCSTGNLITYKATDAMDLTHIHIAKTLGCNRFLTMDQYFERILKEAPIPITILRWN